MNNVINIADENSFMGTMIGLFSKTPFEFGGITFLSGESFLQAVKFKEVDKQVYIGSLESHKARMKGKKLTKKLLEEPLVYWQNQSIELHTDNYYYLIYEALSEKFKQNIIARVALRLSEGKEIIFDNGFPEPKFNTLPNEVLIEILKQIREDILQGS